MNEKMTSVATGVVAVVLAYALYSHFKKPGGATLADVFKRAPTLAAVAPVGALYNPAAPGAYVSTDNLIYGAATGEDWGRMATIDELIYGAAYGNSDPLPGPSAPGRLW